MSQRKMNKTVIMLAAWNLSEVMFPITPVELGEGMVLGSERIHTARSAVSP